MVLDVTPRGEKLLLSDPITQLVQAIAALELGANNFRDLLRQISAQLDARRDPHHADNCRKCVANVGPSEVDLLCFNFERRENGA